MLLPPKSYKTGEIKEGEYRHLVLVLDVSPSMQLDDAGPTGKQKRDTSPIDQVLGDIVAICYADARALAEPNRMAALEL